MRISTFPSTGDEAMSMSEGLRLSLGCAGNLAILTQEWSHETVLRDEVFVSVIK
jgi:hypothetical protein